MRLRSIWVCAGVLWLWGTALGTPADAGGGLGPRALSGLRDSFRPDAHARAMYNAVTNGEIKDLALNRGILRAHDDLYTYRVDAQGITNQQSSGRCWMFSGLNSIRHTVRRARGFKALEFSQIYLTFWDKLEKANTFLERIIRLRDRDPMDREMVVILKDPIPDGGYWENVADLINKYGLVPKAVYPETYSSNHTGSMNRVLAQLLRVDAVKLRRLAREGAGLHQLRQGKEAMLADVYRILAINLGTPPAAFVWRHEPGSVKDANAPADVNQPPARKTVVELATTPTAFFREVVGVDTDDWVNVFNDTTHPYGRRYTIRMTRNLIDGHDITYVNVDIETLKACARRSLQDNTPVMFAANVSVDQSSTHGIMADGLYDFEAIYGIDLGLSKAEAARYRNGTRNHGMVFIGVDVADERPVKWLVENSWGSSRGQNGTWAMYDSWFDRNVYNVIVRRQYVPAKVLKILEQKPRALPVWDPMQ